MSLDKIKKAINTIEFHDLPVEKISVDFENEKLLITVAIYNDETQQYLLKSVEFISVSNFSKLCRIESNIEEIFSLDIESIADDQILAKIVFLTGFSKPSIEWEFWFKDLQIVNC